MAVDGAINVEDLRKLAKRRLPKIAYDFIEGGLEDEIGVGRNEDAFRQIKLVPRYMVDVQARDQSASVFGRTYAGPIGIAPTGLAGLFRPGADLMLAEAARAANVPFIMSGTERARSRISQKSPPSTAGISSTLPRIARFRRIRFGVRGRPALARW